MTTSKNIQLSSTNSNITKQNRFILMSIFLLTLAILSNVQTANAKDCSIPNECASADQTSPFGYRWFDESDFREIKDGFLRSRKFFVHIPPSYDTLPDDQKMPVIFVFHGGDMLREAMIDGKWGDYFDQDIAFVIPAAEADPCDPSQEKAWMGVGVGRAKIPHINIDPNCDPRSQRAVFDAAGNKVYNGAGYQVFATYWDATLPGSFTDVLFIEELRQMILDGFPKLNPAKVYATGFSSGGGMANSLLCYRSGSYQGFSVVGKTIHGANGRGDYDNDGIVETDANSLVSTCGIAGYMAGHATGIPMPDQWGEWVIPPVPPHPGGSVRIVKPYVLFVGDQDTHFTMADIKATGADIRNKNNLNNMFFLTDPFSDSAMDDVQTQRRLFNTPVSGTVFSAFTRHLAKSVNDGDATLFIAAGHGMPDVDECPSGVLNQPLKMTCDYNYTDRTIAFFQAHADLNLNP